MNNTPNAMKSALSVQHGSSGDSNPIVQQLQMMVMRMMTPIGMPQPRLNSEANMMKRQSTRPQKEMAGW